MPTAKTPLFPYVTEIAALTVLVAAFTLPLSFIAGIVTTPLIGRELGGGPLSLNWLINGFMLTFGSSLLAAGVAADTFGRKRVFLIGLGLFAISTIVVLPATSTVWIGLFRAIQGIAAALTLAGGSALLAQLYEGRARTRIFSILGTVFGMGLAFAPFLAGLVSHQLGWRWVYVSLSLISGITFLAAVFLLPALENNRAPKTDVVGILLFSLSVILLTLAVIFIPGKGVLSGYFLFSAGASLLFAGLFIWQSRRVTDPVFDLSLLYYPRFIGVLLLPVATCYCYVVLLVILPLRFMGSEGLSEIQSAYYMLALTGPMLFMPACGALFTRWFNAAAICTTGLAMATIGLVILGLRVEGHNNELLVLPLLIIGLGASLPWGLMDGLAISAVPPDRMGMAAGLFNTVRVAGEAIALAVILAVLSAINAAQLGRIFTDYPSQTLDRAATWLAEGNLTEAHHSLPGVSLSYLMGMINHSYSLLFFLLAGITGICALLIALLLRHPVSSMMSYDEK